MKKVVTLLLAGALMAGACMAVAACGEDEKETGETVTISCVNAEGNEEEKEVPYDPARVAILDYAVLDMLDIFGLGDRVVASSEGTIDYLSEYWEKIDSGEIANLGNLQAYKDHMTDLNESEPDIIFIGGRQSSMYADFEEIAPVVYLTVSAGTLIEDTLANAYTVATIFGIDKSVVDEKFATVNEKVDALKAVSQPEDGTQKTCMVLMYTSETSISALASDGRCSLISNELGFELLTLPKDEGNAGGGSGSGSGNGSGGGSGGYHGDSLSWETVALLNPDYIFVLNRGYITSSGETTNAMAKDVIVNKVTAGTTAAQDGHVIVMENPDAWYTAEGGVNALLTMLADLEKTLL